MIPVIVDGVYPNNYPPALRCEIGESGAVTDQIATILGPDLRKEADGHELGLAKIVAGLTGLETDLVYHRAERARQRRWQLTAALTASVLVVIAVFGALAEIQNRRFVNFMELATSFPAFQAVDDTNGWYHSDELATKTLRAVQSIVSRPPWLARIKILWFDSKPSLSEQERQAFKNIQGLGVEIQEANDIKLAKAKLRERFDVAIANYGSPAEKFAYQLLDELHSIGSSTPLVAYGGEANPAFAREAICHGAVARAMTPGPLFSAVVRAIASKPTEEETTATEKHCIDEQIKPYDTAAWRTWIDDRHRGRLTPRPPFELN